MAGACRWARKRGSHAFRGGKGGVFRGGLKGALEPAHALDHCEAQNKAFALVDKRANLGAMRLCLAGPAAVPQPVVVARLTAAAAGPQAGLAARAGYSNLIFRRGPPPPAKGQIGEADRVLLDPAAGELARDATVRPDMGDRQGVACAAAQTRKGAEQLLRRTRQPRRHRHVRANSGGPRDVGRMDARACGVQRRVEGGEMRADDPLQRRVLARRRTARTRILPPVGHSTVHGMDVGSETARSRGAAWSRRDLM
jgi:hypothetical protein